MAFDPTKFGATVSSPKTSGFDPSKFGATVTPSSAAVDQLKKQMSPAQEEVHPLLSFLTGSANALKKRALEEGSNLKKVAQGKLDPLSSGIQATAPILGAVGDVFGEGLKAAYNTLPESMRSKVTSSVENMAKSEGGQKAVAELNKVMDAWHSFSTAHPNLAADAKGILDISTGLPIVAGAKTAVTAAKEVLPELASTAKGAVTKTIAGVEAAAKAKEIKSLSKMVQSTGAAAGKELKSGKEIVKEGFGPFAKEVVIPSEKDVADATRFASQLVSGNPTKSAANLTDHITNVSEKTVRPFLQANNQGFNRSQLRSYIEKKIAENPITFTANEGEKTYEKVVDTLMNEVEKNAKNVDGLWDSRISFDGAAKAQYPHAFEGAASGTKQAIRNVRKWVNEYIVEKTGGGADNVFAKSMEDLSRAYDVRDNLLEKTAKGLNENAIQKWAKEHPGTVKAAGIGAGAVGAGKIFNAF